MKTLLLIWGLAFAAGFALPLAAVGRGEMHADLLKPLLTQLASSIGPFLVMLLTFAMFGSPDGKPREPRSLGLSVIASVVWIVGLFCVVSTPYWSQQFTFREVGGLIQMYSQYSNWIMVPFLAWQLGTPTATPGPS
jgi:hypothetical protein